MTAKRKQHRAYGKQFKAETVALVRNSGLPLAQICRDLNLSESLVRRWIHQAEIDAGERRGLTTDERDELRQLRREIWELRQERDILRRALVFLARGSTTNTRSPTQ